MAKPQMYEAGALTDFWPELRSQSMVFYAACAGRRAPARSVSEDGRTEAGSAAISGLPDGNHGDNQLRSKSRTLAARESSK